MRQLVRWSLPTLVASLGFWLLLGGPGGFTAAASAAPTPPAPGDRRAHHPETGKLTFIGFDRGRGPVVGGAMARRSMAAQGESLLAPYAAAFGVRDQDRQLRLESANQGTVRFQQIVDGIPVVGGELIVSVSEDGGLESISGEISPDPVVADSAEVGAATAASTARDAVAKWYGLDESTLIASEPELWVLDESLLHPSDRPAALVWWVTVTAGNADPIREYVFVDAVRGSIPLHWNQIDTSWNDAGRLQTTDTPAPTDTETPTETPTATPSETATATDVATASPSGTPSPTDTPLPSETASPTPTASETAAVLPTQNPSFGGGNRMTYSADNTTNLTATLRCTQAQPTCTDGADPHADAAHLYAANAFDFYDDHHGRDSVDGAGMTITSSVHYGENYANAFWNGSQMVYGDGAQAGDPPSSWTGHPMADDVVGHELTHGVTQHESNLYYYYQSGAINESFSDIWGELIDQTNGTGNDSPGVKWLIGEDITRLGAIRSMSNPPAFGDPDRMTSSHYFGGSSDVGTFGDNGGVHTNSGVGNKAAFLMTDGGTFNGYSVRALGIEKAAAIYYEAQTNLLTSGSDYVDLYHLLFQACQNLVGGPQGITAGDCLEVRDATNAVEMNLQPATGYNPDPAVCPIGMTRDQTLFSDDLESGSGNWLVSGEGAVWKWATGFAVSGTHMLWGDDAYAPWEESSILMASDEILPAGSFLRFDHAFGFEDPNYDGGVLEYSTDAGAAWSDAAPLFSDGRGYNGAITDTWGNVLGGRNAFVADSHGYVGSRYNLSTLAGQSVRFRWRMATDGIVYDRGWLIDNVEIYTCVGAPAVPSLTSPANNAMVTSYTPALDWADAASADEYQVEVATDSGFTTPVLEVVTASNFMPGSPLADNRTYWWRVRTENVLDQVSAWSSVRTFRTPILAPSLVTPADGVVLLTTRPGFDWGDAAGASNYTIQVSTVANFASTTVNTTVTPSTYTPTADLPKGVTLYWRVRANGTNGPSAWSVVRSATSADPPTVPSLSAPANNVLLTTYAPVLDWGNSTNAPDHYQVQLSTNSSFGAIVRDENVALSTWTVSPDLNPGRTYWWRVRSFNAGGQYSLWSSVRTLRTLMAAPTLVAPADSDVLLTTRPPFDWGDVVGASNYTIQVSTVASFASRTLNTTVTPSTYTPTADLTPRGVALYWRVRANGTNGPSAWSAVRSMTSADPPSVPSLRSPANNALQMTYTPALDWTDATNGPDHYQVQISTNSTFGAIVQDATPGASTYTASPSLNPNTTYWWRVRSFNTGGQYSLWSSVRTLRTALTAPSGLMSTNLTETTRPKFEWAAYGGSPPNPTNHTIQVSTSAAFASTVVNATASGLSYTPTVDLPKGVTLYWRLRANGANGPSQWTEGGSWTSANPPSVPSLTSPANNALIQTYAPVLDWADSTNAPDHYQVQISTNSSFGPAVVQDATPSGSTYTASPDLNPGATYWWRVRSFNAGGQYSLWSSVRTMRTVMAAPMLSLPADTDVMLTTRPVFDWGDVAGASNYTFQVSTVSNFASRRVNTTVTSSTYTPTADLTPKGVTLYWRVRGNGTNGPSAWSSVRSLTSANPPSVPSLTSPANNALMLTYAPVLDWGDSTNGPDHYQVQLATSSTFGTIVRDESVTLSTWTVAPDLNPATTFWWRVRSFNAGGQYSLWSSVRTLRMVMLAPSLVLPADGAIVTSLRPAFDWTDVTGATSYTLQVTANGSFSSLVINASPTSSTYTPTSNLPTQKVLDVRVRANGPNGPSAWSTVTGFIIVP